MVLCPEDKKQGTERKEAKKIAKGQNWTRESAIRALPSWKVIGIEYSQCGP